MGDLSRRLSSRDRPQASRERLVSRPPSHVASEFNVASVDARPGTLERLVVDARQLKQVVALAADHVKPTQRLHRKRLRKQTRSLGRPRGPQGDISLSAKRARILQVRRGFVRACAPKSHPTPRLEISRFQTKSESETLSSSSRERERERGASRASSPRRVNGALSSSRHGILSPVSCDFKPHSATVLCRRPYFPHPKCRPTFWTFSKVDARRRARPRRAADPRAGARICRTRSRSPPPSRGCATVFATGLSRSPTLAQVSRFQKSPVRPRPIRGVESHRGTCESFEPSWVRTRVRPRLAPLRSFRIRRVQESKIESLGRRRATRRSLPRAADPRSAPPA